MLESFLAKFGFVMDFLHICLSGDLLFRFPRELKRAPVGRPKVAWNLPAHPLGRLAEVSQQQLYFQINPKTPQGVPMPPNEASKIRPGPSRLQFWSSLATILNNFQIEFKRFWKALKTTCSLDVGRLLAKFGFVMDLFYIWLSRMLEGLWRNLASLWIYYIFGFPGIYYFDFRRNLREFPWTAPRSPGIYPTTYLDPSPKFHSNN